MPFACSHDRGDPLDAECAPGFAIVAEGFGTGAAVAFDGEHPERRDLARPGVDSEVNSSFPPRT